MTNNTATIDNIHNFFFVDTSTTRSPLQWFFVFHSPLFVVALSLDLAVMAFPLSQVIDTADTSPRVPVVAIIPRNTPCSAVATQFGDALGARDGRTIVVCPSQVFCKGVTKMVPSDNTVTVVTPSQAVKLLLREWSALDVASTLVLMLLEDTMSCDAEAILGLRALVRSSQNAKARSHDGMQCLVVTNCLSVAQRLWPKVEIRHWQVQSVVGDLASTPSTSAVCGPHMTSEGRQKLSDIVDGARGSFFATSSDLVLTCIRSLPTPKVVWAVGSVIKEGLRALVRDGVSASPPPLQLVVCIVPSPTWATQLAEELRSVLSHDDGLSVATKLHDDQCLMCRASEPSSHVHVLCVPVQTASAAQLLLQVRDTTPPILGVIDCGLELSRRAAACWSEGDFKAEEPRFVNEVVGLSFSSLSDTSRRTRTVVDALRGKAPVRRLVLFRNLLPKVADPWVLPFKFHPRRLMALLRAHGTAAEDVLQDDISRIRWGEAEELTEAEHLDSVTTAEALWTDPMDESAALPHGVLVAIALFPESWSNQAVYTVQVLLLGAVASGVLPNVVFIPQEKTYDRFNDRQLQAHIDYVQSGAAPFQARDASSGAPSTGAFVVNVLLTAMRHMDVSRMKEYSREGVAKCIRRATAGLVSRHSILNSKHLITMMQTVCDLVARIAQHRNQDVLQCLRQIIGKGCPLASTGETSGSGRWSSSGNGSGSGSGSGEFRRQGRKKKSSTPALVRMPILRTAARLLCRAFPSRTGTVSTGKSGVNDRFKTKWWFLVRDLGVVAPNDTQTSDASVLMLHTTTFKAGRHVQRLANVWVYTGEGDDEDVAMDRDFIEDAF